MSHKICKNCVQAWNQSENILVSILIIIMKKIAEKILFPAFMSMIIIRNSIQVSLPRATTYGKLMIIYS